MDVRVIPAASRTSDRTVSLRVIRGPSPARTSCSRVFLHQPIRLNHSRGSLKRSKRDTWRSIGLSVGTLSRLSIWDCSLAESSRFLSLRGSMQGKMRNCGTVTAGQIGQGKNAAS